MQPVNAPSAEDSAARAADRLRRAQASAKFSRSLLTREIIEVKNKPSYSFLADYRDDPNYSAYLDAKSYCLGSSPASVNPMAVFYPITQRKTYHSTFRKPDEDYANAFEKWSTKMWLQLFEAIDAAEMARAEAESAQKQQSSCFRSFFSCFKKNSD